jgi:hypothetical protein
MDMKPGGRFVVQARSERFAAQTSTLKRTVALKVISGALREDGIGA